MLTTNDIAKCEQWFEDNGLPYFVEARHAQIRRSLARREIAVWAVVSLVAGGLGAVAVRMLGGALVDMTLVAIPVVLLVVLARAFVVFHLAGIGRWAVVHAWRSMRLLFPLVTRTLPFLLLFITFLFINTEVWQVASSLSRARLWGALGCFALLAVAFLWPSFAGEIERVGAEVEGARLAETCAGTPVASAAREILDEPHLAREVAGIRLPRLQRSNLMLMLFITQAIQLLLLALIVFGFFCLFGSLVIRPAVVESWTGAAPHYTGPLHLISDELFSVAVFLSGFAGLYFTVQAVIDQNYRREFFRRIEDELQQAIGVRKVYTALHAHLGRAGGGSAR